MWGAGYNCLPSVQKPNRGGLCTYFKFISVILINVYQGNNQECVERFSHKNGHYCIINNNEEHCYTFNNNKFSKKLQHIKVMAYNGIFENDVEKY